MIQLQTFFSWDLGIVVWNIPCSQAYTFTNFQGTGGITVKKTNLALIIGIYDEPMTGGQCNMVVERLGDYLYDLGF